MRFLDVNAPFGYCIPSRFANFSFVRISKNASTSLVEDKRLGLRHYGYERIDAYPSDFSCYACIRDPIDRFVSSIPETLSRYMRRHQTTKFMRSAVLVNDDIACELDGMYHFLDRPSLFLEMYIELVESVFFDAHHQPQLAFLTRADSHFVRDYNLFALEYIDPAICAICSMYRLAESPSGFERKNSRHPTPQSSDDAHARVNFVQAARLTKQRLVRALAARGFYHSSYFELAENLYTKKGFDSRFFYREIKSSLSACEPLLFKLRSIYEGDLEMYNKVLAKSSSESPIVVMHS